MKNIINIINFIRDVEPRRPKDLVTPVKEQIKLARRYGLKSTFLLQYDAFTDDVYIELMKSCSDVCEIGVWFEIVQPLTEKVGLKWRGRYPWDWHCDVGFLVGYSPEDRIRLIDETMSRFKSIFGYYPESVGSWHIDAVSMKYLSEKYHVKACCICRDQVGTDGYTMQGGYYNGAYYPSVNNMFCPANNPENQINMPVFRMLGSDAIYAYDYQVTDYNNDGIPTLEPVWNPGGGSEVWVDWFMKETFCGSGISIQYTQAGQENSFGWDRMGKGLEFQYPYIKKMADEGRAEVMTLKESGKWFLDNFSVTPAQTLKAMTDWNDCGRKSVWYSSRYYRTNVMWENGVVRFRDFYIFNDMYEENYLHVPCTTSACEYRNLPVMDGAIYTEPKGRAAGIYITSNGENTVWDDITYAETGSTATITLKHGNSRAVITLNENSVKIQSDIDTLTLTPVYDKNRALGTFDLSDDFGNHNNRDNVMTYVSQVFKTENKISFVFNNIEYSLSFEDATVNDDFSVVSNSGSIIVQI